MMLAILSLLFFAPFSPELIKSVGQETRLTPAAAEAAIESVFRAIGEELASGHAVQVDGFGRFSLQKRKMKDGEKKTILRFSPSKELRSAVSEVELERK